MAGTKKHIPVNVMADSTSLGISIDRLHIRKGDFITADEFEEATSPHRDGGHTFHCIEKGTVSIEIDFQKYKLKAGTLVYMHPSQVHRILDFKDTIVYTLAINNDSLEPKYFDLIEKIAPVKPLLLEKTMRTDILNTYSFCLYFAGKKNIRLHEAVLKDCCNALVGLIVSAFLREVKTSGNGSRAETVARLFRQLLEKNYRTTKRPAEYARLLNLSTPYLNQCIMKATGEPVSVHIRERVIREAKRLLFHTKKSVKEISHDLGYDDYPYFSRLFTRAAGISALAFRNKNND